MVARWMALPLMAHGRQAWQRTPSCVRSWVCPHHSRSGRAWKARTRLRNSGSRIYSIRRGLVHPQAPVGWQCSGKNARGAENHHERWGYAAPTWPWQRWNATFSPAVAGENRLCRDSSCAGKKKRLRCWLLPSTPRGRELIETKLWQEMNFVTSAGIYEDRPPHRA